MFGVPSRSTIISVTALVISLGGAAFSANGGAFLLGRTNTATALTRIVTPINGPAFRVDNSSSAANATGIAIITNSARPPLLVNSAVRVANLNADKLDNLSSEQFSRVMGFKRVSASGGLTSTTDNYYLAPAFTATLTGRCLVIASTQVTRSTSTGDRGPFYRLAIKRGSAIPANDGQFGHYFAPIWGNGSSLVSPDLTRTFVYNVTAGEVIQFGVYLGFPPATWTGTGTSVDAKISYFCSTIGSSAGPSELAFGTADEPDMAGIQQDRQARAGRL